MKRNHFELDLASKTRKYYFQTIRLNFRLTPKIVMKYVFFIPLLHQLTTDSTKDLVAICSNILGY